MTEPHAIPCPGCPGRALEIRILDRSLGPEPNSLEYALPDASRGFWSGQLPVAGRVVAFLCGHCGRIQLFGRPAPGAGAPA